MVEYETGKPEPGGCPLSEGAESFRPQMKGGLPNGYISGFILVLYFRCIPCWSALSDLQGTKIAATIRTDLTQSK